MTLVGTSKGGEALENGPISYSVGLSVGARCYSRSKFRPCITRRGPARELFRYSLEKERQKERRTVLDSDSVFRSRAEETMITLISAEITRRKTR